MLSYPLYRKDNGGKFKDLVSGRICLWLIILLFHALLILNMLIDFFIYWYNFFIQYILINSFPFSNCSQNLAPPLHPAPSFSLFQRKTIPQIPKTKKYRKPKPKQIKTIRTQKPRTSFCLGQLLLSMGPALKCSWYTQYHFAEESWF